MRHSRLAGGRAATVCQLCLRSSIPVYPEACALATAQCGPVQRSLPTSHDPHPRLQGHPTKIWPWESRSLYPSWPLSSFLSLNLSPSCISRTPSTLMQPTLHQCPAGTPAALEIKDPDCVKLGFTGIEKMDNRNHTWCWQHWVPCPHPSQPQGLGDSSPHGALPLVWTRRPPLWKTARGESFQCAFCCQLHN